MKIFIFKNDKQKTIFLSNSDTQKVDDFESVIHFIPTSDITTISDLLTLVYPEYKVIDNPEKIYKLLLSKQACNLFLLACDGAYNVDSISNCNTYDMGLTKLYFDENKQILNVYVRKPGLLIGKMGSNLNKLEQFIGCKIYIHEITNEKICQ